MDIDLVCVEWLNSQLQRCKTRQQIMQVLVCSNKATDEYLLNNLENLISNYSKEGKPVILVGYYVEVIYRGIVARTLGKYFENIVSLFCCELNFHKVEQFMKIRESEFLTKARREDILAQYLLAQKRINLEGGRLLGFGMDHSFVVNSTVSDMF